MRTEWALRVPEEIWPGNAISYFSKKLVRWGAAIVFHGSGNSYDLFRQEFLERLFQRTLNPLDWTKQHAFSGI